MISTRLNLLTFFTRNFAKRWLTRVAGVPDLRRIADRQLLQMQLSPPFAIYRNGVLGGVPVKWASCGTVKSDDILFYIHGGGFIAGSPDTHKHLAAHLSKFLGIETVMPEYRLAPEHPFPAGFDDVVASYNALIASGRKPDQIILGGDSAGGGLMFSLLAYICKNNLPRPKCCFALSPIVDFTYTSDSLKENAKSEAVLVAERFEELSGMYLGDQDPKNPYVSPLFADFPDCPPILIHVGDGEILRDDTLMMQRHLLDQGVDVLVRSWATGFHVWHIMVGYVPEARAALKDIAAFIRHQFAATKR